MNDGNAPPPPGVEAVTGADLTWMREALAEAARGLGRTAPNPPVGCVIVRGGEVVGRGFHPKAGEPHAEVFALREAGGAARGATAYVTLEPCAHFGRTPPCADALIDAGVTRVVVAALDPNPQVAGRGVQKLRAAGIDVTVGVLDADATRQQAGFRSLIVRGQPWVVAKYAMTLDGRVAALNEGRGAVSGDAARNLTMRWRNELDAIAVGAGTLALDNPALTTRGVPGGRDPRPVLFSRSGRVPPDGAAIRPGAILVTAQEATAGALEAAGMTVIRAETIPGALRQLGGLGISTLLLEGGPRLLTAFFSAGLVDEVRVFIAPKLLGAGQSPLLGPERPMAQAQVLQDITVGPAGPDVLVTGRLSDIPRL